MLEKQLAKDFNDIFREYHILTPSSRIGGWPDKGVQIANSRIVWFELKIITLKYGALTVSVDELTKEQAAWLAKWQYKGGFCYLFLGIVGYDEQLIQYAILRCSLWSTWLQVPKRKIKIDQLLVFTEKMDVLQWFKGLFQPQSTRATSIKEDI